MADARFRHELALCHGWGIPHSEFLAWPELDQDKALAYASYAASVCSGCGTRADEWDPAAGGARDAYAADVYTCPGCQVRGDRDRELREGGIETSGRYVVLIPRAEAARRASERAERLARRAAAMAGG